MIECNNVAEPFMRAVEVHPDRTALIFSGTKITYRGLNERINRIANSLKAEYQVKPGDRVAYLLPNCPEIIEVYYAIQKIGAIAVPLNYKLIPREISYLVNASETCLLVFSKAFSESVETARESFQAEVSMVCVGGTTAFASDFEALLASASDGEPQLFCQPDALSRIQYTGGSTGIPKGAARSHHADLIELDAIIDSNGIGEEDGNVVLIQCPLEHHGGHSWFTTALSSSATIVICEAFNPEQILRFIELYRVTYMILLPPTTYLRLLRCPTINQYDLSSVKLVQSSAGAMTDAVVKGIYDAFPNAILNYGWGQSESGAGLSLKITREMLEENSPLLRSVGRPMIHVEMKIVDDGGNELPRGEVGEALYRSESTMDGYFGQPDLTSKVFTDDGWLRTGDLMKEDEAGYFYVCSRKKDMIKSGGENVFVGEVENVLRSHPDIDDCMVFGTDDPIMGEAVAAVVQLRPSASLTVQDVQDYCKRYISSYKKPRYVVFIDNLGRDNAGKVRKQEVVDYFNKRKGDIIVRRYEKVLDDPCVYLIKVPFLDDVPLAVGGTNAYLIKTDGRNLLVDTGVTQESSYDVLRLALSDLKVDMNETDIFLTHFHVDHAGLAASIAEEGTKIYLSAEDEWLMRCPGGVSYRGVIKRRLSEEGFPEESANEIGAAERALGMRVKWPIPSAFEPLEDGQVLKYGSYEMKVIATPGHTSGHRCLYLPKQKALFLGDHVLMRVSPSVAPFPDCSDVLADYLDSLEVISKVETKHVFVGHGAVDPESQSDAMGERVDWLRKHHLSRLEEVKEIISENPGITGTEIAMKIKWSTPFKTWEDVPAMQKWVIVCETLTYTDHLTHIEWGHIEFDGGSYRYYA